LDNEEIKTNLIGEIYICVPFAKAESKKHNWTLNYEINLLFAHGLLHLLGYDHNTKVEEKVMFDLQEKLIKNL
jgi:probable rRNA maturation factor